MTSLFPLPEPTSSEALYQEDYYREESGERFLSVAERVSLVLKGLRLHAILRRKRGPGSLLDIGCGRGDLLQLFQRHGWKAVGTQISRTAAESARKLRGVDVRLGELPELALEAASFDVITMFHVLEHLRVPGAYLREAHRLLKPDGLLVVEVPNYASPGFFFLGTRDLCFDHPHHLYFFTPDSLRGLLERCGFQVEGASHFSLEYSPFTTLQNLLNLLPGPPNRFYRALMGNAEGRRLRGEVSTWLHGLLALILAIPATLLSLVGLVSPWGNTMRLYARPISPE